jgi:hypothetical protein
MGAGLTAARIAIGPRRRMLGADNRIRSDLA